MPPIESFRASAQAQAKSRHTKGPPPPSNALWKPFSLFVSVTRQGVTQTIAQTEIGVVLTDKNGSGSVTVVIGPVP